ncbi:MAG: adenosylcobalamin-dependent ribonucleoside-diphosphate reductase [Flavobacteriaceae bacterium]
MLTKNAIQLLEERYLLRRGTNETPDQLFRRVAKHVAGVERLRKKEWEEKFYGIMKNLEFLPNSPTLMNAGLPNGQLSACFVLPVEDSLTSIFSTLKNAALIHQSGGGTGYNFSDLRPKGDPVGASGGTSSGPLAFMDIYDSATEHVKQGGKRRGANMGILNVDHPDIESFIVSKTEGRRLQNFNISVGITDDFMHAVALDGDWTLVNPRTKRVRKTIKAKSIWDAIVREAWKTGDPGLVFLDAINSKNPTPEQGSIKSTHPCGEVPLLDYESCNLGSLNIMKVLKRETTGVAIDWQRLETNIQVAMRFLDNVISVNHYLLPQIREMAEMNRKVGLGVMGWAELLISLNIPYASDEAVALGDRLMDFVKTKSYEASRSLASERGTFLSWASSIHSPGMPLRNATCNSIAPTGSISVIANTSYSIEPLYALSYERVGILGGKTQAELNAVAVEKLKQLNLWNGQIKEEVLGTGSVQQLKRVPKSVRKLLETSQEVSWKYHLDHQRVFQKHTDNAVSKTINLPKSATEIEISKIYRTAWEYGLKGITIYRDGSKPNQILQKCGLNHGPAC